MNEETLDLLSAIQNDHNKKYSNVEVLVRKWHKQQAEVEGFIAPLKQSEEIVKKHQELLDSIKKIEESQKTVFVSTKRVAVFGSVAALFISIIYPNLFVPVISLVTTVATLGYMLQLYNDRNLNRKATQAVNEMKST